MRTRQILDLLRAFESRNITLIEPDGSWPIVWERARGIHVWDANGKKYLDLTAAFGVANAGHAHPKIVHAGQKQMARLLHAMGDVHPHPLKAQLARVLSQITFERWARLGFSPPPSTRHPAANKHTTKTTTKAKVIFCNSGFEAVEAALKTAALATRKPGIIAFTGAYHGLGYGALNATYRDYFKSPFLNQLAQFGHFIPFPSTQETLPGSLDALRQITRQHPIGAVLVEPIQVRGGVNIPPPDFLPALHKFCRQNQLLLVLDEIYTGFGRTGRWFACEHQRITPDLICLGKALTGGFPLSACVGHATLMDHAWPPSTGEAIHTSTFAGHPVGCAMALAQIQTLKDLHAIPKSAKIGACLLQKLKQLPIPPRHSLHPRALGLLAGLEIRHQTGAPDAAFTLRIIKKMLAHGVILLPEGEHANVISFTPPLVLTEEDLAKPLRLLASLLTSNH